MANRSKVSILMNLKNSFPKILLPKSLQQKKSRQVERQRRREELDTPEGEFLPMDELLGSIILAGKTRLRPVLLTAITTVLGLIPLAIGMNINFGTLLSSFDPQFYVGGDNAAFWGPMAWTVIFGLTFATFLTLVVVPVMYLLADKLNMLIRRLK